MNAQVIFPIVLFGTLAVVGVLLVLSLFGRDPDRTPQANLGCGTLILIAIIVSIFNQPRSSELASELKSDISRLNESLEATQQTLNSQADDLAEIRSLLEEMQGAKQEPDEPLPAELQPEAP